jgi:teichuronic acid biosynthesis glycosyltransferase TuaC
MRLLVFTQGYPSQANSMAGIFHRNQMAVLSQLGCEVTLVAPTPWVPPGLAARNPRWKSYAEMPREQMDGAVRILRPRYLTLPRESSWGLSHITQGWAVRLLGLPKPDLIHAFYALPTGLMARDLSARMDVPYVLTLLGDDVNIYPFVGPAAMKRFRLAMSGAAAVTANGPTLGRRAHELSGMEVEALSLGVDFTRFDGLPSKAEARALLGLPESGAIGLYAGNLLLQKGVAELDEALRRLARPDLLTVCAGNGPERGRLEANPGILCVGSQPGERIPLYMRAADFLMLPSHHEGLPTVVIEAGGAGLPVVGSDIGGLTDLLEEDRGYIHRVKDAASLAAAIQALLSDPAEAARRAARLADFVRDQHDVVRNSGRLMEIYTRTVGQI